MRPLSESEVEEISPVPGRLAFKVGEGRVAVTGRECWGEGCALDVEAYGFGVEECRTGVLRPEALPEL